MRKKILISLLTAVFVCSTVTPAYADVTEGGTDLSKAAFTDSQKAVPFVSYIYIEDDADNNYNDPNRDVGIDFAGAGEYYLWAHNYQFGDSDSFKQHKVVRMTGELPSTGDYDYYPTLMTSDRKQADGDVYFIAKFNDKDYAMEELGNGISPAELDENYNEFIFVGGSYDWVSTKGKKKLDELYTLYHSDTGNISDAAATSIGVDDELFTYWQQKMNADTTIMGWKDEDGNIYDANKMNQLGYPVTERTHFESTPDSKEGETEEVEGENGVKNTQSSEASAILVEQKTQPKGVPPLVFVILGIAGIIGAVVIAFIKREKNESDLYID